MNDQHPHAGYAAHDGYSTGSFDSDPLFGALPGASDYAADQADQAIHAPLADHTGQYDSTQWSTGYAPYTPQPQYDAYATPVPQSYDTTGQWDANAWNEANQANQAAPYGYDLGGQTDQTGQWGYPAADTGAYDATAWNTGDATALHTTAPAQDQVLTQTQGTILTEVPVREPDFDPLTDTRFQAGAPYYPDAGTYEQAPETYEPTPDAYEQAPETYESADAYEPADTYAPHEPYDPYEPATHEPAAYEPEAAQHPDDYDTPGPEPEPEHTGASIPRPVRRAAGGGSRGRRRTPAKRSALLTVAVPSACVMGVAGIAAASVSGLGAGEETKDDTTSLSAAEATRVKPAAVNNKLDTQLAALDADARDFGDRASRTQERIDLQERQAADKKKRDAQAAAREAARPKFAIPVKAHGLSAYYGQAGVNWMSMHTGIDFPVSYGTPVMAATDGTVRTQWNSAYGNMAIVTAADGTETWYCHLSSTKIRSGSVKAGDEIAYSGNSGNSTGPHLHFEVRPGGGAAIDPLAWYRSHGLDPS